MGQTVLYAATCSIRHSVGTGCFLVTWVGVRGLLGPRENDAGPRYLSTTSSLLLPSIVHLSLDSSLPLERRHEAGDSICSYISHSLARRYYHLTRSQLHQPMAIGWTIPVTSSLLPPSILPQTIDRPLLLQHTQRPTSVGQDNGTAVLSARVDTSGATLGTAETCTLLLADSSLLPHHASITYNDGRFYLTESLPPQPQSPTLSAVIPSTSSTSASTSSASSSSSAPTSCGVWSRLSLKGEESVPHVLCSGDLLRAGFTELQVDIRAIPPSNAGGYGFGTSGPLPSTLPATPCEYDVGVALTSSSGVNGTAVYC